MQQRHIAWLLILGFFMATSVQAQDDVFAGKGRCMTCHKATSPGLYRQWLGSKHSTMSVTCYDCHRADKDDPDAFKHGDFYIATLVTPKDCARCHPTEVGQVKISLHATAGEILETPDSYMVNVIGGLPAMIAGCESCHGNRIKIDPKSPNKLARESWPNSGIGRINPDGSKGSCNACHSRHSFSKAQARRPETCGKCHLGPDHPQKEIYEESKHGIAFFTHQDQMHLDSDRWVVGEDYFEAPTCVTCHMGATKQQAATHDVGQRLSWTLRPAISEHKADWQKKRGNMKDVCQACHGKDFVEGHFYQFDGVVNLYDEKFAKPATQIMDLLRQSGKMEHKAEFSNDIEWIYWELWHHEGRRARHGAAMMGPDFTWWKGMYEVAKNFYFKFLPAAKAYNDPAVNRYIDNMLKNDPMHDWMDKSPEELKQKMQSGELENIYRELFKETRATHAPNNH